MLAPEVQIILSERRPDQATVDQGVASTRTWRVVELTAKHALLLGGLGWGNMPEHMVRDDLRGGRLVKLRLLAWSEEEHRLSLSLVRRVGAVDGPVTRWAQTRLASHCQAQLRGATAARR